MAHFLAHGGICALCQRPEQECQCIRFVVVGDWMAQCLHRRDHYDLARITFAGGMTLDGANEHALVGDLMAFAPGGQLIQSSRCANLRISGLMRFEHMRRYR